MKSCLALGAFFALTTWGCQSPRADFDRLCRVSEQVMRDDSVPRPEKPRAIRDRFSEHAMHRRTRACVGLVFGPGLDPSAKYEILEQCALDAGVTGWSCPALRDHWAKAGQPVLVAP
jgi:hypothetical protein